MLETNGKSYLGSVFKLTQAKHPISVCVRLKLVNPFIIKDDCVITDILIACPPDREHILFEVVLFNHDDIIYIKNKWQKLANNYYFFI